MFFKSGLVKDIYLRGGDAISFGQAKGKMLKQNPSENLTGSLCSLVGILMVNSCL